MSNFNIRVNGAANLTQMKTEFAKLTTEVDALNAAMERSVIVQGKVNPKGYAQMAQAVKVGSQVTRDAALSTGMFEVQQLKLNSATEAYTDAIQKQKLGLKSLWNEFRNGSNVRKAAYKEQLALQQMMVQQMPGSVGGKKVFDVYIPNEVNKSFDTLGKRIGFVSEELKSASTQMINWGKNTQWAGRQLMVGFTMPVAMFGAGAATMAYKVDQQMTRIRKVYDTTASQTSGDVKEMAAANQELARLSEAAMNTAKNVASQYGQSITDTLDVQAELAATGEKGAKLQQATMETMRIATLGELDTKTATTLTVSLQSAFKDTIKTATDLTNTFDYMNAVENATSLSTQDMAEAIPRAASSMAALGVDAKQMIVMLAAMKQNGVDAAEGANALKSATTRIINPVKKATDFYNKYGISLEGIAKESGGNLYKYLELFGKMQDHIQGPTEKQTKLLQAQGRAMLFGTYQNARLTALIKNLSEAFSGSADSTNQATSAIKLMGDSFDELHGISETEIGAIQKSLSGRLRIAIESTKAELADMGKPFLEVGVSILGVIDKILHAFNTLPGGMKKGLAVGAIVTAAVGPLIMLAGLSVNFVGNIVKMGASLLGLAGSLKIISKDSKAAQLATELVNKGFVSETTALQQLTAEMRLMTQAAQEGALAQKQLMLSANSAAQFINGRNVGKVAPIVPTNIPPSRTAGLNLVSAPAGYTGPTGYAATTGRSVVGGAPMVSAPIIDDRTPEKAKETSKWLKAGAVSAGLMSASMVGMMTTSDGLVHNLSQWGMIAAVAAPAFSGIAAAMKSIKWSAMTEAISTRAVVGVNAIRAGLANSAISMGMMARNLTSGRGIVSELKMAGGGIKSLATGAKGVLGSFAGMVSPVGWIGIGIGAAAGAAYLLYQNAQKGKKEIQEMYENVDDLGNILGFVPAKMAQTIDATGKAITSLSAQIDAFREKYKYVTQQIRDTKDIQEAFNYAMAQGLKTLSSTGDPTKAREAVVLALKAANRYAEAQKVIVNFEGRLDFSNVQQNVDDYIKQMQQAWNDTAYHDPGAWADILPGGDSSGKEKNKINQAAKDSAKAYISAFNTATDAGLSTDSVVNALQAQLDKMNKAIADADPMSSDWSRKVDTRYNFLMELAKGRKDNEGDYVRTLTDETKATKILSDLGFNLVTSSGATADNAGKLADNTAEAAKNAQDLQTAMANIDWQSAMKTALSDTQDQIAEQVQNRFTAKMQKSIDAYKAAQDKRLDVMKSDHDAQDTAFENRWDRRKKAVEDAYDAQIKKTNDAIDAEKKADDIRQKIFQAEITRMQRLADAQNTNIDFNVALNAGNLDEAAKIQNDAIAQDTQWALSDVGDAEASKSQAKQDRLSKKADRISKAKDKALDALAKQEKAAKDSLDRRQKMEEQALQDEITANEHAQKRIWDIRKKNMDKAIKLFKDYVPTNEKDLKDHVAAVSKQYEDFNLKTTDKFNTTAKVVGHMLKDNIVSAAKSIQADVQWGQVGEDVAKKFIRGAFGMSPNQFQTWLETGEMPDKASLGGAGKKKGKNTNLWADANGKPIYHTGGIVGVDKGGRAGIRAGHPDEVSATLLKGEGVLNRKAMGALGPDGFRALNSGNAAVSNKGYGTGGGGLVGLGLVGVMGAMMQAAMRTMTGNVLTKAAGRASTGFSSAQAGSYGNVDFSSEQLSNAATIASVGKSLGMSSRDIEIGIMTAITESGLRNLNSGDRDSLGLFQQRPSQGWGSAEQVTNPTYAATKFFNALKGIEDRANMSPWLAAQAVQRSAFSDGSNYQKYWENAQAIFNGMAGGGGAGAGFVSGSGGWHKASVPGKGWGNSHDYHNGPGSPLYAASDGTVVDSRAITSGGSPGNGVFTAPNGQPYRSYGETIAIRTASGDVLRYAHLSPGKRYVTAGQQVKGGSLIGLSGWTGNATGPHTHFDVNGDYNAKGWMEAHGISLSKGAQNIKWDNTIANLHKGEAVLTEDINNQFKQGVKRFAEGPNAQYNVYMNINGANVDEDKLVNKTMTALRRAEQRKPQSRSGS